MLGDAFVRFSPSLLPLCSSYAGHHASSFVLRMAAPRVARRAKRGGPGRSIHHREKAKVLPALWLGRKDTMSHLCALLSNVDNKRQRTDTNQKSDDVMKDDNSAGNSDHCLAFGRSISTGVTYCLFLRFDPNLIGAEVFAPFLTMLGFRF